VGRGARRARAGLGGRLGAQQPVDLAELAVGLLELGGPPQQDVEAEVVADGHLVREAAEVELQLGDLLGELGPAALERARRGRERRLRAARADAVGQAHLNVTSPDPPPAGLLSLGGSLPGVTSVLGSLADFLE
jgi:hypothetical protein